MNDFFDRLDKYMKYKGLNDNKVTVEAGISVGLIGKGRKRGGLSQDNISKILYTYVDLNANWWFRGKGNMLNEPIPEVSLDYEKIIKSQQELLDLKEIEINSLKDQLNNVIK